MRYGAVIAVVFALGCSATPVSRGNPALARFEAYVDNQQVRVPFARALRAVQAELRAVGLQARQAKRFAGRTIIAATRGDPRSARTPRRGCNVEVFNQPTGLQFRALCFQQPAATQLGALPQRVEWQDRFIVARILARLDRALGQKIWSFEPTGFRTHACAHAPAPRPRRCRRR